MSSVLLSCPHCQHEHEDAFEVLAVGAIDDMRCEACKQEFSFVLLECRRCTNEQAFTWPHRPPSTALRLLTCEPCGIHFGFHDANQEEATDL
jgi:transcription elongation factor Elf1